MDVSSIRARAEDYRAELELDRYELDRGVRTDSKAREIRDDADLPAVAQDVGVGSEGEHRAAGEFR